MYWFRCFECLVCEYAVDNVTKTNNVRHCSYCFECKTNEDITSRGWVHVAGSIGAKLRTTRSIWNVDFGALYFYRGITRYDISGIKRLSISFKRSSELLFSVEVNTNLCDIPSEWAGNCWKICNADCHGQRTVFDWFAIYCTTSPNVLIVVACSISK